MSRKIDTHLELRRRMSLLRLLHSAIQQSKEAILITDAQLELPGPRIVFANFAFTKMTGYTVDEIIGKTPRILHGPRTDKKVLKQLRNTLTRGDLFEGEIINYRKDGTEFYLEWHIAPIRNKSGIITHFVATQRDISRRKNTEEALIQSEEKFRQLAVNITDVFWIASTDLQQIHYISPGYEQIWGRSAESLYANPLQWAKSMLPEEYERVCALFLQLATDKTSVHTEFQITRPDGTMRCIFSRGFQVRNAEGKVIRITGIATDITERKQLEARLFQSQKMETIGKLAGGIAHEFNSILTAIIGQSELLLSDLPAVSPLLKSATEINNAARRAAALTRQLLAYGRKQILKLETLNLNNILVSMESMLRHLIGSNVDFLLVPSIGLQEVKADSGQIEQVIINMVTNAAEAMPNGGKLILETANVSFNEESVGRYPELKPGNYVMLAITDTGIGMSEEVKAQVFEPFFTTKGIGQGIGLGLATCYGIIKQSNGHISIYSELGRGSAFKIYLPQVEQQKRIPIQRLDSPDLPRGTETILLVEDDPSMREMAATLLRRLGYTVFTAANGIEALSLKQQHEIGRIDLLFTDVVMPHMSGKELSDRIGLLYPHTKTLFTSAYTENAIIQQGVLSKRVMFLQKPFTPSVMAHKLREVLNPPIHSKREISG